MLLSGNFIARYIVETLKKEPETGIFKLLEMAGKQAKTNESVNLIAQISNFFHQNNAARVGIKNLIMNTSKETLQTFIKHIIEALESQLLTLNFFTLMTPSEIGDLNHTGTFPLIEVQNIDDHLIRQLQQLKKSGFIFFLKALLTTDRIATFSDINTIRLLIQSGVRGLFIETTCEETARHFNENILSLRTKFPLLIFHIQKKTPDASSYLMSEVINREKYEIELTL